VNQIFCDPCRPGRASWRLILWRRSCDSVTAFDSAVIYRLVTVYDPAAGLDSSTGCVSANTCDLGKIKPSTASDSATANDQTVASL
jgi:hypothetical protein